MSDLPPIDALPRPDRPPTDEELLAPLVDVPIFLSGWLAWAIVGELGAIIALLLVIALRV